MKRKQFDTQQIADILKELEAGKSTAELCRAHGVSQASIYKWRKRYSGTEAMAIDRMRELEEENRRLKAKNEELELDLKLAKEVIEKKP